MSDPAARNRDDDAAGAGADGERRRFILGDTGFQRGSGQVPEVLPKWRGAGDSLAPNK